MALWRAKAAGKLRHNLLLTIYSINPLLWIAGAAGFFCLAGVVLARLALLVVTGYRFILCKVKLLPVDY